MSVGVVGLVVGIIMLLKIFLWNSAFGGGAGGASASVRAGKSSEDATPPFL